MQRIIDTHCDAVGKMLIDGGLDFCRDTAGELDVTAERMRQSNVGLQTFAIYLSTQLGQPTFELISQGVDLFKRNVIDDAGLVHIRDRQQLVDWKTSGRMGAMLSLEGADALNGDFNMLQQLFDRGVRSIGLTWNYANWAADGVMEPRQGGLTASGIAFVQQCERIGMLLDTAHLSERAFWDLAETTNRPFLNSHANAKTVCDHPRNLTDQQISTIVDRGGCIGLTFVPPFVDHSEVRPVQLTALLRHIDHCCSLGAEYHLGFGSDFDGIGEWISGLEHAGCYQNLVELLLKHYSAEQVNRFMFENWYRYYEQNLPQ